MAPPITCECGECRKCKHRAYMRAWYRRNPQKVRESSIRTRARRVEAARLYDSMRAAERKEKMDQQKRRAGDILRSAIYRGAVVREPCEVCGEPKSHGHHDDYSQPLEVRWLCVKHHMELHRTVV